MKKKIKVSRFLQNGAELVAGCLCGILVIQAGVDAGVLPAMPFFPTSLQKELSDFSLSTVLAGTLGAYLGNFIAKNYMDSIRNNPDSIFELAPKKVKMK